MTLAMLEGEYKPKQEELEKYNINIPHAKTKEELKSKVTDLESYKVLIEVVNDIEFMTAICQMDGEIKQCKVTDSLTESTKTYYYGKWEGVPVVVVQTGKKVGSQFLHGSWFETKKALHYMPQLEYVFGVGVCGAAVDDDGAGRIKPRVPLGHIVVSSHIKGYDHQRKGEYDEHRGYESVSSENKFYQFINETPNKFRWNKGLHFGKVLSGSWLVADKRAQYLVLDPNRKDEKAFEMEGVGMAAACSQLRKGCLVVKGVSDYANRDKDDKWQPSAARNATRFLSDMLKKVIYVTS